jgi:uncharacterized protein involved in exopolysaccharide biosynthesis
MHECMNFMTGGQTGLEMTVMGNEQREAKNSLGNLEGRLMSSTTSGTMPVLASQMRTGIAPAQSASPMSSAAGAAGSGSLDLIKLLLKYKWLLVATVLIGAALGAAAHFALMRVYPRWTRIFFQGKVSEI